MGLDLDSAMATKRFNVKLPKFKLTKRSTTGQVSHQVVPLGCLEKEQNTALESTLEPPAPASAPPPNAIYGGNELGGSEDTPDGQSFPSLHHIMQKQTAESWGKIIGRPCSTLLLNQRQCQLEKCVLFVRLQKLPIAVYSAALGYFIVQRVFQLHIAKLICSIRQKFGR